MTTGSIDRPRRRGALQVVLAAYVVLQLALPLIGLVAAHEKEIAPKFSWAMFSRLPPEADADGE
jgi:hypothetical protein